jgi:dUTP pyrophosphatase
MKIKIVNKSNNELPIYATDGSAGMDLRAFIETPSDWDEKVKKAGIDHLDYAIDLKCGERMLVHTGLYIELPEGYEAQVRPRSGLALKHGITVLNTPGTIDHDYRGEVCVILANMGCGQFNSTVSTTDPYNEEKWNVSGPFLIKNGDRIAQMVINKYEKAEFELVDDLSETERGSGGFNSTGIK